MFKLGMAVSVLMLLKLLSYVSISDRLMSVDMLAVFMLVLVLVLVLALKAVFKFKQSPHESGRENNEKAVALTMLLGYLVVIIAAALNIHLLGAAV